MAILLESRPANGAITRTPLEPGRNAFRAQPNTRYRILDDTGAKFDDGVTIKRVGNDLLVTGLPEEKLVEFDGFFIRCTAKNPCELMLENLGGTTPGASITPMSESVAALRDGGFLMYETKSVAGTVPVTPEAEAPQSLKTIGVAVAAVAVLAAAGGGGSGGAGPAPDSTAPAAPTLTDNVAPSHAAGPVTFTFTFNEALAPGTFTADDVAVTGGTKGAFTQLDATHYSLVVSPSGATGTITVAVNGASFTDLAGNPGTGSVHASQPFNTQIPSITGIADDRAAPLTNQPTTFTFTLSEAPGVDPFTASDIVVTGGTAQTFTAIDATHYSLLVQPTPGVASGTMEVSVAAGAFSNNAGTANAAEASASQGYDTLAPTQTMLLFALLDSAVGPILSGGLTRDTTPTVVLSLNRLLQSGDTLHVLRDSADIFTSTSASSATFTFDDSVAPRPLDDYLYTARITDAVGNVNPLLLNHAVTVVP